MRQADAIQQKGTIVAHGPDTLEAFDSFDIESILKELKAHAPDLYSLFKSLGNTRRNATSDEISVEDVKAISSLCYFLNARYVKVNGMQLLMSFMLIARATTKQVSFYPYFIIYKAAFCSETL